MALKVPVLFLTCLLILIFNMYDYGDGATEIIREENKLGFFNFKDINIGGVIPIDFPNPSLPPLLPREEAETIPFSLENLSEILNFFFISPGSSLEKSMEKTLTQCHETPIERETRFCATSLESMLDFVRSTFGPKTHFKALSTRYQSTTNLRQNFTVLESPREVTAAKMIGCHLMNYPYAVFYCHSHSSHGRWGNKALEISLGGENGERIEGVAVCHMDTSGWKPDHISFKLLGLKPGDSGICHFLYSNSILWVGTAAEAAFN